MIIIIYNLNKVDVKNQSLGIKLTYILDSQIYNFFKVNYHAKFYRDDILGLKPLYSAIKYHLLKCYLKSLRGTFYRLILIFSYI